MKEGETENLQNNELCKSFDQSYLVLKSQCQNTVNQNHTIPNPIFTLLSTMACNDRDVHRRLYVIEVHKFLPLILNIQCYVYNLIHVNSFYNNNQLFTTTINQNKSKGIPFSVNFQGFNTNKFKTLIQLDLWKGKELINMIGYKIFQKESK